MIINNIGELQLANHFNHNLDQPKLHKYSSKKQACTQKSGTMRHRLMKNNLLHVPHSKASFNVIKTYIWSQFGISNQ